MGSKYLETEQLLIGSFINNLFGYPIEVSGLPTDIDKSGLYVVLHHVPSETSPVTLGDAGQDNNVGFMQVDIMYPKLEGHASPLACADIIASAYPAGLSIVGAGVALTITRTSLSPKMVVGGLIKYALTVYYYTRTSRN